MTDRVPPTYLLRISALSRRIIARRLSDGQVAGDGEHPVADLHRHGVIAVGPERGGVAA